jgi:hypothetical protein
MTWMIIGSRRMARFWSHGPGEAKRLQPTLSIDWIERHHPMVRESDRGLYSQGLRSAGLE